MQKFSETDRSHYHTFQLKSHMDYLRLHRHISATVRVAVNGLLPRLTTMFLFLHLVYIELHYLSLELWASFASSDISTGTMIFCFPVDDEQIKYYRQRLGSLMENMTYVQQLL